ncbi:unnamed protein product [Fusarium graminearum]|nr:hypothetical protein FG05_12850 [Fusarium graminearum]CZS84717.1 unnamed protein product [Fusarium graminearum]
MSILIFPINPGSVSSCQPREPTPWPCSCQTGLCLGCFEFGDSLYLLFPEGWVDSQGYILSHGIPALHASTRGGFGQDVTFSHSSGNVTEARIYNEERSFIRSSIDVAFDITRCLTASPVIENWLKAMSGRRVDGVGADVYLWVLWHGLSRVSMISKTRGFARDRFPPNYLPAGGMLGSTGPL